jgi:hypothetical protein
MNEQAGGKKIVHFGNFVRREREIRNWSRAVFGKKIAGVMPNSREPGFSDKRIFDIEKMPTPGRIRERTFVAMGRALGWETREEFDAAWRSTPVEPYPETDERFAESAVSRLLGGQPALVTELQAAAVAEGITLPELFQRISREWLAAHTPAPVSSGDAPAGGGVIWEHPDGTRERRKPFPAGGGSIPAPPQKPVKGRKGRRTAAGRIAKRGSPAVVQKSH